MSTHDTNAAMPAASVENDSRTAAISLMHQALNIIDGDPTISGIVGAQLQMAIDSLSKAAPRTSQDLH